jgi:gluconate 5-dehydrogenase
VTPLFDLRGRVAIVTGGGSGLGRQMAHGLAEAGADVVVCARHLDRCELVAEELRALGVRTLALRCDVRDQAEVESVVDRTLHELGSIDVLVNNAGTVWAHRRRTRRSRAGRRSSTSTSPAPFCSRRRPGA